MSITKRAITPALIAASLGVSGSLAQTAEARTPDTKGGGVAYNVSDQDALSPTYTSNGHTYGPKEGLTVMSGVIDLGGGAGSKRMSSSTTSTQNFGSSYAKSTERWQWYYDGAAYASGKDDYKVKSSNPLKRYDVKRVVQVCFKYTRNSKDVIGWQCSNASLGPTFAPGKVVKKTVHDTINPVAAKTQFHYSIKTI